MTGRAHALVLDIGADSLSETASRLRRLRLPVFHARNRDEADRILDAEGGRIRALLFAPSLGGEIRALCERLAQHVLEGQPTLVAVGRRPDAESRARLRSAGIEHALWEPFDDGMLRFVVNEALAPADAIAAREGIRVPTCVDARVEASGRSKKVHVYSLSTHGAFLETPRPSLRGARFELEIPLPDGPLRTAAHVVFTNVPGNLQRPKLPLGMGVRFEGLDEPQTLRLRRFVEERATRILV